MKRTQSIGFWGTRGAQWLGRRTRAFGLGAGAWALLMASCGGSSTASSVPEDQLVDRLIHAICDNLGPCCRAAGFGYDQASCMSFIGNQSVTAFPKSDLQLRYDAAAGQHCIDVATQAARTCGSSDEVEAACKNNLLWHGAVSPGSPCTADRECAAPAGSVARCMPQDQRCQVLARGKLGDGCSATFGVPTTSPGVGPSGPLPSAAASSCYIEDGLFCDSRTQLCTALGRIGDACVDGSCEVGDYCDVTSRTCQAARSSGPCEQDAACIPETSYCDLRLRACSPKKPDGAACESSQECLVAACSDGLCQATPVASSDLCSPMTEPPPSQPAPAP